MPDALNTAEWDFDPSTWLAQDGSRAYLVDAQESKGKIKVYSKETTRQAQKDISGCITFEDKPADHVTQVNQRSTSSNRTRAKGWNKSEKEIRNSSCKETDELSKKEQEEVENWGRKKEIKREQEEWEPLPTLQISEFPNPKMSDPHSNFEFLTSRLLPDQELSLSTIFSHVAEPHTQAELISTGNDNLQHFVCTRNAQSMVLTTPTAIAIGNVSDPQGNNFTNVLLLGCAVAT